MSIDRFARLPHESIERKETNKTKDEANIDIHPKRIISSNLESFE